MRARRAPVRSGRRPAHVPVTSAGPRGSRTMPLSAAEKVRDVVGGARGIVEGAVVLGIGRPDVRELTPRHHEDGAVVGGHGDDRRDVVAYLVPRQRDVHALGGTDRCRLRAFVELADVVGPHSGRVDDAPSAHVDHVAVDRRRVRRRHDVPSRWRNSDFKNSTTLGVVHDRCTVHRQRCARSRGSGARRRPARRTRRRPQPTARSERGHVRDRVVDGARARDACRCGGRR